jgi:ABC-type spermidine/putrescine transport systems, ATPase components
VANCAEAAVLEFSLNAQRGSFHLRVDCRLTSEWTVIFGHSGSGKSTLLRLLAGLDRNAPRRTTQAHVVLDGGTLTDTTRNAWLAPGHRKTALVSQHPSLFPHLSIQANIAYGLQSLDRSARSKRVQEMLELADATDLVELRPQDLSGGQAQRIALARALAPAPRLLLLDEPFSALDGAASDALVERLKTWLHANHVQTVIATHDATDAYATNAEVAMLKVGRIAAFGPAAEVLEEERKRIVSRLSSTSGNGFQPSGDL